jgi:hypothetical protein
MSETYGDTDPAGGFFDPLLRPVWEDTPDETDRVSGVGAALERLNDRGDWLGRE